MSTKKSVKLSVDTLNKAELDNQRNLVQSMDIFLKIMAEKNITIDYCTSYDTAFANLETNTIYLPAYILKDKNTYLRFATHEVAHLLYTPKFFYEKHDKNSQSETKSRSVVISGKSYVLDNILFSAINIVEDIRIEKLIRINFPGLIEPYRKSVKGLLDTKQWEFLKNITTQEEFDKLELMNKINVKTKFKEYLSDVDMSSREYAILKYVSSAKTFNDVLVRAKYLYLLHKTNSNVNEMSSEELERLLQSAQNSNGDSKDSDIPDFDEQFDSIDKTEILNLRDDTTGEDTTDNTDTNSDGTDGLSTDNSSDTETSIESEIADMATEQSEYTPSPDEIFDNNIRDAISNTKNKRSSLMINLDGLLDARASKVLFIDRKQKKPGIHIAI